MNRKMIAAVAAGVAWLLSLSPAIAVPPPESGWEAVDRVFGQQGKDLPGDVHKFSWPRTDLKVSIAGVAIEPALALGSWGAFQKMEGGQAEVMGNLVLLGPEVAPVLRAPEAGGFEILAVHNHLIGESPRVMYVHYQGKGEPAALAQTLKDALGRSATPRAAPAGSMPGKPDPAQEKTFQ